MPYVARDADGKVVAVSLQQSVETPELLSADSPEVMAFMAQMEREELAGTLGGLFDSDTQLVRVLEDLIDVLIDRELIHFTDLPEAAQKKLLSRQSMRRSMNSLNLIGDDGHNGLI